MVIIIYLIYSIVFFFQDGTEKLCTRIQNSRTMSNVMIANCGRETSYFFAIYHLLLCSGEWIDLWWCNWDKRKDKCFHFFQTFFMLWEWTMKEKLGFSKMRPGKAVFYLLKLIKWQRRWRNINFIFSPYFKKNWVKNIYQHGNTNKFADLWLHAHYRKVVWEGR